MNALAYRPTVTVVDVLDAGACLDGVKRFVEENDGRISAPAADFPGQPYIQRAANADMVLGDGDGYGDGYGDGDGDGYGDGYGYGDGDGDGYGYGDGDGDGYGDGEDED